MHGCGPIKHQHIPSSSFDFVLLYTYVFLEITDLKQPKGRCFIMKSNCNYLNASSRPEASFYSDVCVILKSIYTLGLFCLKIFLFPHFRCSSFDVTFSLELAGSFVVVTAPSLLVPSTLVTSSVNWGPACFFFLKRRYAKVEVAVISISKHPAAVQLPDVTEGCLEV